MYYYGWSPHARQQIKKLSSDTQRIIIKKLNYFLSSSNPLDFASPLKNSTLGNYRFRIGNYRVIFDIEGESIIILTVGHRREVYK